MNKTRMKRAAALATALALAGCAASMPDWRASYKQSAVGKPASPTGTTNGTSAETGGSTTGSSTTNGSISVPRVAPDNDPGASINSAVRYLKAARNAYREQVKGQMDKEGNLSQGLLAGAGALLAAAGLKAHPDTFVAGGAALSTIYAMGATGMPRSRVLAYMAGIEALNCAEAAVAPIRSFQAEDLKVKNNALRKAAGKLKDTLASINTDKGAGKQLQAANRLAQETLAAANGMVDSTDDFLAKTETAAYVLANHVEKVDAAVTRSIINGMPDLADVKILSGAIGVDITSIVGKAATDANNSKQANGGTSGTGPVVLDDSSEPGIEDAHTIGNVRNEVIDAMQAVRERLPTNASNLNMQAVADCNLPSVPAPLKANLATVRFFTKKAQTTSIELSGGTKEYVVDASGLPTGLTVKQPGPTGSTVDIVATDQLGQADTYNLRIHDQTPGGNGIVIHVVVAESAPPAPPPNLRAMKTKKARSSR